MLQTHKDQPAFPREQGLASPAESLEFLFGFVRQQYPVVVFVALLGIALGAIYVVTAPSSYTAQAMLMIDSRKVQLFQQQSVFGDLPIDTAAVESQIEVLKSETVALAVIKNLHLTEYPEFVGGSGFFGLFGAIGSSEPKSEIDINRRAVRTFQNRLEVKRVGLSYVIAISFRSLSPERSAEITNAVADAYIVDQLEAKYQATRRASVWLQDRIRELREQASTAERAVVEFKTKNNIVSTGGTNGRLMGEQQVAELNSQLVISRAQTSEARARLDRIESVLRTDSPDQKIDATVADTLKNEVITKLRSQYLELANREAEWSARYGANHLATVNLRNRMREIRNSILDELRRIAEGYKSDYQIAVQRERAIQKELSDAVSQSQVTNRAQVALRELESNSQTYRSLYDNFLQRYMESVQQQSFPISESRVISAASRPSSRSHPKSLLVLAISAIGGVILGLGIGLLRDLSDRVFRTSEQVTSLLGIDCISLVPQLKADNPDVSDHPRFGSALARFKALAIQALGRSKRTSVSTDPKSISRNRSQSLLWSVVDSPFSRFSETIRAIKLAADLNSVVKSTKVIGFTSSLPNEGKSTLAMALAQLMSQGGGRTVILVDCDIRNPSLTRRLTPSANAGILEVIAGTRSLEEVIRTDPATGMVFLPAVVKSRLAHSSEILASEATKNLFNDLRKRYDYVVVDLSPLAPVVDVRTTTHLIDSYVLVIEWGRTKIDVVTHALNGARGIYKNLLGAVLNKTDMNLLGRFEGRRHTYYHNDHYKRYGYIE